ncbi:hypothetical protein MPSEU_000715100 [Mayamaea pseudoterrestris]|nr:hypothetical protein MPSEU_000715100 [Mayamaea pseudoterrestris]
MGIACWTALISLVALCCTAEVVARGNVALDLELTQQKPRHEQMPFGFLSQLDSITYFRSCLFHVVIAGIEYDGWRDSFVLKECGSRSIKSIVLCKVGAMTFRGFVGVDVGPSAVVGNALLALFSLSAVFLSYGRSKIDDRKDGKGSM